MTGAQKLRPLPRNLEHMPTTAHPEKTAYIHVTLPTFKGAR